MEEKDKQLLLKDLCARLPYDVVVNDGNEIDTLKAYMLDDLMFIDEAIIRPYLRPMSSMTDDERKELSKILNYEFYIDNDFALVAEDDRHRIRLDLFEDCIDWLNEHMFDYRDLIEKGLALETLKGMYKI
jgi:hypothetical protein